MKYDELRIETQRQAPARAKSEGAALLRRAGYLDRDGQASLLGEHSIRRLEKLSIARSRAEFFGVLGLPVVQTEDGLIYHVTQVGDEDLAVCDSCGYAPTRNLARFQKAASGPEAPAPLERRLTPDCHTIEALARFLDIPIEKTAKAMMFTRVSDGDFIFVVLRGDMQLSDAKLQRQVGEVRPATLAEIEAAGATPGYASPIGIHRGIVLVDDAVASSANLVAGANEAGYHLLNTNFGRDYQADVVLDLALAGKGDRCPKCGHGLSIASAVLVADPGGYQLLVVLATLADANHDEKGLVLPAPAAPFDVYLMHIPGKEMDTRAETERLYNDWQAASLAVLLDDREARAGVKFNDADLIGCPVRVTVGERALKDGMVELKFRRQSESMTVPLGDALRIIQAAIETI